MDDRPSPAAVPAVEVVVARDDVDLVAGLLWGTGITALVEEAADLDAFVVLRCDLPSGGLDAVRAAAGPFARDIALVAVEDGLDAWREHAAVVRVGRRLVVHPPWVPLGEVRPDEVVVELEPGRAWGHGAHPTTQLCLAEVERLVDAGGVRSVLDVGSGSGSLAVAAAMLDADVVVACDVDPAAVAATRATAERNGVGERVEVHPGLDQVDGRFDLVVANIGAATLVELAPALLRRLSPAGALVVSGLLDPPPAEVAAAYRPLAVDRDDRLAGWAALTLRQQAGGGVS